MYPGRHIHPHPLLRYDSPPADYIAYSSTVMPTCDVCGDENIGVAFHCKQCQYDECEHCHKSEAVQGSSRTVLVNGRSDSYADTSKKATSVPCLPLILVTIGTLAALTVADLVGLVRVTESIRKHEPHIADIESNSQQDGKLPGAGVAKEPFYEATPERVWQTSGLLPGNSRRAILYLVSNSTKERKREPQDFPPGSQGVAGPDGYYVQHLYWSLKHAEENFLPYAAHPDVLILYAEDVDGPAVAREAAKFTKSAVVAQPINFKRTAPGWENATTAFTTCWEGNDWSVNFLNMNYAFVHTMWSLPAFEKYDLLMRIDTDLAIKTRVPCDPFARVERYSIAFAFYSSGHDGEGCTRGQKALAQRWAKEHGLDTNTLDAMGGGGGPGSYSPVYNGAIHLYNLTFWKRPDVQELLRVYADDGGIYRHRWSDQSTFPFVLAAFNAKLLHFGGFETFHVMSPIFKEQWGNNGYCRVLPVNSENIS